MKLAAGALVALLILVVAVLGIYRLVGANDAPTGDGPGSVVERKSPDPIPADDQRSLIRADRLGRVLAKVGEEYGADAKLLSLRVAPESVALEVVGREESEWVWYDSDAQAFQRRPRKVGSEPTVPLSRVFPAIPMRIMELARRKFGIRLADLGSIALSTDPAGPYWVAFGKEGDAVLVSAPMSGQPVTRE